MTFGFDYHLYNSSYHTQKSAIYSYKANSYLSNCGHNIVQIAFNPRFIGLATCALFLVAASFIPFLYTPMASYFASHTVALISGDPALIFTGAVLSSGQYYSLLDKTKVFGATLLLLDEGQHGVNIAKCFVDNIKNICAYTSYKILSWNEYFKSFFSDFFHIDKGNDETLEALPQKVPAYKDLAEAISIHQQYIVLYCKNLANVMNVSSKAVAWEGGKLLGINALMSSVLLIASAMQPYCITGLFATYYMSDILGKPVGQQPDVLLYKRGLIDEVFGTKVSDPIGIIGFLASVSPFLSSDYVQKYCNGDVFSIKSLNYHLAQYASKEIYDEFIDKLGTGVIESLKYCVLITYHYAALCQAKWQQSYEQPKATIDTQSQEELACASETADSDISVALSGEIETSDS